VTSESPRRIQRFPCSHPSHPMMQPIVWPFEHLHLIRWQNPVMHPRAPVSEWNVKSAELVSPMARQIEPLDQHSSSL
jgi:hypothetical protein